jgi:amino acid transporter
MISRALGPALGGSIGLMFTIANTISVSTYTIGFAESMLDFLQVPNEALASRKSFKIVIFNHSGIQGGYSLFVCVCVYMCTKGRVVTLLPGGRTHFSAREKDNLRI